MVLAMLLLVKKETVVEERDGGAAAEAPRWLDVPKVQAACSRPARRLASTVYVIAYFLSSLPPGHHRHGHGHDDVIKQCHLLLAHRRGGKCMRSEAVRSDGTKERTEEGSETGDYRTAENITEQTQKQEQKQKQKKNHEGGKDPRPCEWPWRRRKQTGKNAKGEKKEEKKRQASCPLHAAMCRILFSSSTPTPLRGGTETGLLAGRYSARPASASSSSSVRGRTCTWTATPPAPGGVQTCVRVPRAGSADNGTAVPSGA